jgi:hypothetical protein
MNSFNFSETLTDSASQLEREDVTQHPVEARIVSEYELRINRNECWDSEREEGSTDLTQCPSGISATVFQQIFNTRKSVYEANNPVRQKVRGHVTVRPLRIQTGRVFQVVINRDISQYAGNDSIDRESPRKVTQRPLMVKTGSAYQLVINRNTSKCAADEGQSEVTRRPVRVRSGDAYQPVTNAVTEFGSEGEVGREAVTPRRPSVCQREPSQATVFWFLCASTLMWALLFCCVFINKLQSV